MDKKLAGVTALWTRRASAATITAIVFSCIMAFSCKNNSNTISGPKNPNALNVLFIGNSLTYANDLPGILQALLISADVGPVEVASVASANFGLQDHWTGGDARPKIAKGGWDVVILQQGPSATEGRPSLIQYSELFASEADNIDAQIGLYMVWPSEGHLADFSGVRDSYLTAALNVNGLFFPSGEAWRMAWQVDSSLAFYSLDGFHPTRLGTYLAALVIFEQLAGRSPVGLPNVVQAESGVTITVDSEIATLLQEVAEEANQSWAVSVPGWPPGG